MISVRSDQNNINPFNTSSFAEISLPNNLTQGMANNISFSEKREYVSFIKDNFGQISQREMARRLGVGKTSINRWSSEIGLFHRKHVVNNSFFDDLDELACYLLGYIFTDGNVAWNTEKGYYSLTITAAEKDKEHLEKVRQLLASSKPLLYGASTRSYRLIVNSKPLCRKLMSFGVIPRKSLVVQFPQLPKEGIRHFIRGVIDGDGSVIYNNRKRSPYFAIRICSGSLVFLQVLVETVLTETGIPTRIRKLGGHIYGVEYSCSRGKKLGHYVYDDALVSLERKYLVYKNNVLGGTQNG